jgi:hypothetical protein
VTAHNKAAVSQDASGGFFLTCSFLNSARPSSPPSLIEGRLGGLQMNRKGVDFTLMQVAPGLWKWQFQIGETVTTGKTHSNLMGMAAHSAQKRIDSELKKPRLTPELTDSAN